MVAAGFLRLVTHPSVFVQPKPHDAALAFLRAVLTVPDVEMPRLGSEWPVFERLCEHHRPTGNDIPDAWIAAAVLAHHDHLVSFDKIPPFPEGEPIHFAAALNRRVHDILRGVGK